ncbi:UNVERIFIED_CONTAM: hypothetical protein Scaly_0682400 [Sesamum calycinum]|uniref:DDE Tnp4 domain-containing protein n=1 Tax=Sesamum calycinum TaxID=2727403 RepID=A0AAW2R861_9LAMI
MFSRNTATGGLARSSAVTRPNHSTTIETMNRWMVLNRAVVGHEMSTRILLSLSHPHDFPRRILFLTGTRPLVRLEGRRFRRVAGELQAKKCETMDRLNESLQGKIDRTGPKATESIERCVDELTKFTDLPDNVFTTALERFHSHSTRTIFLRLNDENKLRWIYGKLGVNAGIESNSGGESPGTPGTPGSNESDVPEEFYAFRDLICPELFRENVPRNTSALQGRTVGMHKRHRDNMERFQHSLETINRRIASEMDGTLVPAWVPRVDQHRYRSRKGRLAQNVLAICDFDMNFTYVYAGWEGSAADARVLDNAVSQDPNFPFPPIGKYYLVDAGFANYNVSWLLTEEQGITYLSGGDKVIDIEPQDMFNHAHSRLRNVIERCFGVLKKRFPIIQWGMPSYLQHHQQLAYRRYLESAGFPQEDHWTLNVEQRFMWMILDDNTRAPMRDDARAETQMDHWARRLRRHFVYPYTRDQVRDKFYEFKNRFRQFHGITLIPGIHYDIETFVMVFPLEIRPRASAHYPLARRYYQYPEPHYPSMLEVWGPSRHTGIPVEAPDDTQNAESSNVGRNPVRGGEDAPIVISDSTAPLIGVPRRIVRETAQRAHADHRVSHQGGVMVLRPTMVDCENFRCVIRTGQS